MWSGPADSPSRRVLSFADVDVVILVMYRVFLIVGAATNLEDTMENGYAAAHRPARHE